jgi:hypothetical protein
MLKSFVLALFFGFLCASPEQARNQPPKVQKDAQLQASLESTGARLVSALEKGDSAALFSLFSKGGVVFEIDGPTVPLAFLKKTFSEKRSYYCRFFDTACMREESAEMRKKLQAKPSSSPENCYRDRILRSPERHVKAFVNSSDRETWGQISIYVRNDDRERYSGAEVPLDFELSLEDGVWKIVNVEPN